MANEKSTSKKKIATSALAVGLAAAMLLGGGTFAYLQDETGDTVNTFNTNKVTVDLAETTDNTYEIIPGMSDEKDPTVTVNATVDSYVYVTVTDETDGLVTYEIADGWTLLDGTTDVYYREAAASDVAQTFAVLKDNKVSYDASLVNGDMTTDGTDEGTLKKDLTLTFKASAIQKAPFNDPVLAYNLDSATSVAAESDLSAALNSAEAGDIIKLTGDIALTSPLTINTPVTILGDGSSTISGMTITANSDVTFNSVVFEKPTNSSSNATVLYARNGAENIVLENCTFSNPQWEVLQATSNDLKSIVINNCTFNADNVEGAANSGYGSTASQAIRYIHVQPSASPTVDITITNNTFNDIANVKDSVAGIYYVSTDSTITVGGNSFNGWAEGDVQDGVAGKLSVGWPEVQPLKTVSLWEGEAVTYTIDNSLYAG